jgi:hypothetical protein
MSVQLPSLAQRRPWLGNLAFSLLLVAVGAAGAGLLVVGENPALAVVPVALVAFVWVVFAAPLRWTTSATLLVILAVDESTEAGGLNWVSPLSIIGDVLLYRIDHTLPIPGAALSGMEVMIVLLFLVRGVRLATGSRLDEVGRVRGASVVQDLLLLYVGGVMLAEVVGLAQGWGAAVYKLRNLLHPALLAALFLSVYRGGVDAQAVGRVIVAAACSKAILAHIVQAIAREETGGMFRRATSHGDTMILVAASAILIFRFLEQPKRAHFFAGIPLLALIFVGIFENNRRLAWVILGVSCVLAYAIRPLRGWQRPISKTILLAVPLALLYVAVGWNSGNRIFRPVQTLRGVSDTSHDSSAYWREVESWNIIISTRGTIPFGMGLGGEYTEYMPNDTVDYAEYREWPHNTVLGLLMLMGLFGFTAHWVLLPAVILLATRSYRMAQAPEHRVLALSCLSAVVSCYMMAWGDTGAHFPQYKIFAALAVAFASKLAVETGAWPRATGA